MLLACSGRMLSAVINGPIQSLPQASGCNSRLNADLGNERKSFRIANRRYYRIRRPRRLRIKSPNTDGVHPTACFHRHISSPVCLDKLKNIRTARPPEGSSSSQGKSPCPFSARSLANSQSVDRSCQPSRLRSLSCARTAGAVFFFHRCAPYLTSCAPRSPAPPSSRGRCRSAFSTCRRPAGSA